MHRDVGLYDLELDQPIISVVKNEIFLKCFHIDRFNVSFMLDPSI